MKGLHIFREVQEGMVKFVSVGLEIYAAIIQEDVVIRTALKNLIQSSTGEKPI